MNFEDRWNTIEQIGTGGQGVVFRVYDKNRFDIEHNLLPSLSNALRGFSSIQQDYRPFFDQFRQTLVQLIQLDDPNNHGALKVLHQPNNARDFQLSEVRLKREIEAMQMITHPNLLKILDADPDLKWYVSQFHPRGTLSTHGDTFTGNVYSSLKAIRPLVSGVAVLHRNSLVHRDIKPQNIFIGNKDNLILGDFGLVFFTDQNHTRISAAFDNVGSTDWMPGWASRMRIDDIKPTFDVYSLGKVIWAMISGVPVLRREYFMNPEFNVETMFPNSFTMKLANRLFSKCIVERQDSCLNDASALLNEIDRVIEMIEKNYEVLDNLAIRKCRVCGVGVYTLRVDRNPTEASNFGFPARGDRTFKVFSCEHCGHVQLYLFGDGTLPSAWE
jgi:serine/threonine protein kinase